MNTITSFQRVLVIAAAGLSLTACGGDDSVPPAGGNVPPASASASAKGFIDYIQSLAGGMFDTSEPVDLSAFTLPTDDTEALPPYPTSIDQ
jgi:hypothetical protein